MDLHSMKRKELQALCKKHNIPANLTNLEMANKLASILKEKEKPVARGKSCLRSTEQPSDTLSDDAKRQSKTVRFSPENDTVEFLKSKEKPVLERASRRRSMLRSVVNIEDNVSEKNVANVKFPIETLNNPVRLTRSRAEKVMSEDENLVAPDAAETKRLKRDPRSVASERVSKVKARALTRRFLENKQVENNKVVTEDALLRKNPTKRTSRKNGMKIDDEVSEIEVASRKKTEEVNDVVLKKNQSQRTLRSRVVKTGREFVEEKGNVEDDAIVETQKVVRRSKRNAKQIEDLAMMNLGLGEVEEPLKRSTRKGTKAQKTLVRDKTGKAVTRKKLRGTTEEPDAQSEPLEEIIPVVEQLVLNSQPMANIAESSNIPVTNSREVLSDNADEETQGEMSISGIEIDRKIDLDKIRFLQDCAANEDNFHSDNLALLESEVELNIVNDVVPPEASLGEEDYSQFDQPDCTAEAAKLDLPNELGTAENKEMKIQAPNFVKQDRDEPQAKLDVNHDLEELEMDKNNEPGKYTDSSSVMAHDEVDAGNSYSSEAKHFVEPEAVVANYDRENKTPSEGKVIEKQEVKTVLVRKVSGLSIGKLQPSIITEGEGDMEHTDEGYSAQHEWINSTEGNLEIADEEPEDSSVLQTSVRKEITPTKTEVRIRDENLSFIEPEDSEELMHDFENEGHLAQDTGGTLKEKSQLVNEEDGDYHLPDSSDRNRITASKVENKQSDKIEISPLDSELLECTNSSSQESMVKGEVMVVTHVTNISSAVKHTAVAETKCVLSPSVTGRSIKSSLREKKYSKRTATPISVSNEIRSLMLEDLDKTSASEFGKVHNIMLQESHAASTFATVEPVEDLNKVIHEITRGEDHHLPLPHRDRVDSLRSPFVASRNNAAGLNEQKGPTRIATPLSVANEIKSLMLVNLDRTPTSELGKVHKLMIQEDHAPTFVTVEPVEDLNKVINESTSEVQHHSPFPQEDHMVKPGHHFTLCDDFDMENLESGMGAENLTRSVEVHNSGEQSKNQKFQDGCSTELEKSEGTETEFDANYNTVSADNETQPFKEISPQTTSGHAENKGNICSKKEMSPTELGLLFGDQTPGDGMRSNSTNSIAPPSMGSGILTQSIDDNEINGEDLCFGNNFNTEEENRNVVTEEVVVSPTERKHEDTQVIGSYDDSFVDTTCVDSLFSPSNLSCTASASKSIHTNKLQKEDNEGLTGIIETVSDHGHENAPREINVSGDILSAENAEETVTSSIREADFIEKHQDGVLMEDVNSRNPEALRPLNFESDRHKVTWEFSEGTSTALDKLTTEIEDEDLVNASRELEGDVTKVFDGMFDDFDGHEIEIVQEMLQAEEVDSPSYSDHYSGHENELIEENTSTSTENSFEEDEIEIKEKAVEDMTSFVSNEASYIEECLGSSQKLTKSAEVARESHCQKSSSKDIVQRCVELNKDAERQILRQATQSWSPDPEDPAIVTNPLDNQEQLKSSRMTLHDVETSFRDEHLRSESNVRNGKFGKSAKGEDVMEVDIFDDQGLTVSSLFSTEAKNTGVPFSMESKYVEASEQVASEITWKETNPPDLSEKLTVAAGDVPVRKQSVDDVVQHTDSLAEHTEAQNLSQGCTPSATRDDDTVASPTFDQGQSFEFANSAVKEGSATEDFEQNLESVDMEIAFGRREEQGEMSVSETNSTNLEMETRNSLIQGTPKKPASNFDMKENATSIKRENISSVTAKSTARRRALMELPK